MQDPTIPTSRSLPSRLTLLLLGYSVTRHLCFLQVQQTDKEAVFCPCFQLQISRYVHLSYFAKFTWLVFPYNDVSPRKEKTQLLLILLPQLKPNISLSSKAKLDFWRSSEQSDIKLFGCGNVPHEKTTSHFENKSGFVTHPFTLRTLKCECSHVCRNSDYFDSCGNLFIFFWSYLLCVQELIVTLETVCACVCVSVKGKPRVTKPLKISQFLKNTHISLQYKKINGGGGSNIHWHHENKLCTMQPFT